MAMYKALRSFSGIITMRKGMEKEINDDAVAQDLIKAGFVVALDSKKADKSDKAERASDDEIPAPKKAGRKKKEDA